MNTPAHLIFGAAAFGGRGRAGRTWAALAGSLAPDLSLYAMAGWCLFVRDMPARRVFGELYYSPEWQQVFAVDNSFVLWGAGLALALWARAGWAVAFAGAGMLHLAFDFPLHNHDARMHFWPLTEWKFFSPLSYWDSARGGAWVGLAEAASATALCAVLVARHASVAARLGFGAILAAELASSSIWRFVF